MKTIIKRWKAPTPVFFAKLSKRLKMVSISFAGLGVAVYSKQEQLFPIVVEIGKMASAIGCFGVFFASIIADLTVSDEEIEVIDKEKGNRDGN